MWQYADVKERYDCSASTVQGEIGMLQTVSDRKAIRGDKP